MNLFRPVCPETTSTKHNTTPQEARSECFSLSLQSHIMPPKSSRSSAPASAASSSKQSAASQLAPVAAGELAAPGVALVPPGTGVEGPLSVSGQHPGNGSLSTATPTTAGASTDERRRTLLIKKIKNAFNTFDQSNNGTCDVREVGTIIRSLDIFPSEEQLRVWIKEMEEEEPTGYIQYERFLKVVLQLMTTNSVPKIDEEQLFRAFQALDVEKKGYLMPDELRRLMQSEGEPFSNEEMDEMLNACTDPVEGKVFYEEYCL
ncbi:hypothetical protein DFJ73DRAFT_835922 [Zopfochytrium polystomum]|nr:hypothetical protein DFJ73DRAFT_835922 [Zopfochytrium polystomum]